LTTIDFAILKAKLFKTKEKLHIFSSILRARALLMLSRRGSEKL